MVNYRFFIIPIFLVGMLITIFLQTLSFFVYSISALQFLKYSSIFLFFTVSIYHYINRSSFFSLGLIVAFVFSLFLGGPAVYLLYYKDLVIDYQIVLIFVIQINTMLYFFNEGVISNKYEYVLNNTFYFLFFIVLLCQVYKIILYLIFILNSGAGHLAIYTEGDALRGSVPLIIRGISGFSIIMSMMTFFYPSSRKIKLISMFMILSDVMIGIRGKFFFSVVSILFLYAYTNKIRAVKIFTFITGFIPIVILFIILSTVSYFREGYTIDFYSYIFIVLDSISSTIAGLERLFIISGEWWSKYFSYQMVIDQIIPILGFDGLDANGIAKVYSLLVLGDLSSGLGLSSSIVLESMVIMGRYFPIVLLLYLISFILIIPKLLNSNKILLNVIGLSFISGFLFSVRAEMVLPIVFMIKFFPIIIFSPFLVNKKEKFP
ncbi:O-antigen polymerase [Yersinia pseudotuberculosis]|uniref:Wzy n=1 Tax=Yersinia pseudotuberculosis TaxID=633 RepID=A0A380Q5X9_YERPU|nr:O-antigen polymerase [Yersinia pseudotuberculosis]CNC69145.1 Uncharacterised protein [Yersinia pseudotuberculosis]SUP81176.1 Uncharacterised protein [Yersinia pseudotuberculosis]